MSDLSPALTEDMVERAAAQMCDRFSADGWDDLGEVDRTSWMRWASAVLEVALGSRVVEHRREATTPGVLLGGEVSNQLIADCSCGGTYTIEVGENEYGRLEAAHAEHVRAATAASRRVVLDLPEPDGVNTMPYDQPNAVWNDEDDALRVHAFTSRGGHGLVEFCHLLLPADTSEAFGLRVTAAAREARRLAAGCPAHGRHPHEGMRCLDCPDCVSGTERLAAEAGDQR